MIAFYKIHFKILIIINTSIILNSSVIIRLWLLSNESKILNLISNIVSIAKIISCPGFESKSVDESIIKKNLDRVMDRCNFHINQVNKNYILLT